MSESVIIVGIISVTLISISILVAMHLDTKHTAESIDKVNELIKEAHKAEAEAKKCKNCKCK